MAAEDDGNKILPSRLLDTQSDIGKAFAFLPLGLKLCITIVIREKSLSLIEMSCTVGSLSASRTL